jgi:hypothetical protein
VKNNLENVDIIHSIRSHYCLLITLDLGRTSQELRTARKVCGS